MKRRGKSPWVENQQPVVWSIVKVPTTDEPWKVIAHGLSETEAWRRTQNRPNLFAEGNGGRHKAQPVGHP
jgi:hypothetical protein